MQKRGDRNPPPESREIMGQYMRGGSRAEKELQKSAHGAQISNLRSCGVTPRKAGQEQLPKNNSPRAVIQTTPRAPGEPGIKRLRSRQSPKTSLMIMSHIQEETRAEQPLGVGLNEA